MSSSPTDTAPARPKRNGITQPSRRGGSGRVLTDVLVDLGFVDRGTMDLAIERGTESGAAPERVLVTDGTIDADQLARDGGGAVAGPVPDPDLGRAGLVQRVDDRSRGPSGAQDQRRLAVDRARQRGEEAGRVGVVGVDGAAGLERERVGGPDRARGLARGVGER